MIRKASTVKVDAELVQAAESSAVAAENAAKLMIVRCLGSDLSYRLMHGTCLATLCLGQ